MYTITFHTRSGRKVVESFDTISEGYIRAVRYGRTVITIVTK